SERTGRALSQMGLTRTVQDIAGTIHGFRSSFRDWASEETAHDFAVVETALAHAVGSGVERAYRRGDLLAKRRVLMDAWGDYVVVGSSGMRPTACGWSAPGSPSPGA
ncbi:MAG: integrase, partial [Acidobacteria bacterium]|nr:integrase [Acidobacteriota bacterium]